VTTRQRAEATRTKPTTTVSLSVTWRGTVFTLPTPEQFPLDALEAEENGKQLAALKLILGDEQYATWRGLARTAGDAEEFSEQITKELGRGNR
jgi:hypothetical protein